MYQTTKESLEEEDKELEADFLHEFVNTHNQEWRPLRGLWHEDILEFFKKRSDLRIKSSHIALIESEIEYFENELKEVIAVGEITSNNFYKGKKEGLEQAISRLKSELDIINKLD